MVIASIPPTLSQIRAGILQVPLVMGVSGVQIYYDPTPLYESLNFQVPFGDFFNFFEGGSGTFYFGQGFFTFSPPLNGQDLSITFDSLNVYTSLVFAQSGVGVCSLTAGNSEFYYNADHHIFRVSNSSAWHGIWTQNLLELAALSLGGTYGASVDPGVGGIYCNGKFYVAAVETPSSASASGVYGQIAFDSNYMYRCTATDTWKRAALATW